MVCSHVHWSTVALLHRIACTCTHAHSQNRMHARMHTLPEPLALAPLLLRCLSLTLKKCLCPSAAATVPTSCTCMHPPFTHTHMHARTHTHTQSHTTQKWERLLSNAACADIPRAFTNLTKLSLNRCWPTDNQLHTLLSSLPSITHLQLEGVCDEGGASRPWDPTALPAGRSFVQVSGLPMLAYTQYVG